MDTNTNFIFRFFNSFINYLYFTKNFNIFNSLILCEFLISLFILLFLLFALLKRNYVNVYALFLLNIIFIILFTTVFIEEIYLNKFLNYVQQITCTPKRFLNTNDLIEYFFLFQSWVSTLSQKDLYSIFFGNQVIFYYNGNFIFSFFDYYVKLFSIFCFFMCLIIGFLNRKTLKINFNKIILILLPLLLSSLIIIQSQDLIIAYLSIELQNLCLIFLMSLKKKNYINIQLSVRFFILNSIGSLFILFGIVLLYINLYTTNFSDIYLLCTVLPGKLFDAYLKNSLLFSLGMMLIGLMFKLGVGPFGLWLVDIYEYSLTYGVLIFSILPKISYFIFIFHLYLATSNLSYFWDVILKFFGIFSIVIGTFGALQQNYLKRLLAFSSLNYFGYILLSFVGFNNKSFVLCVLYLYVYVFISFYIWFVVLYLERVTKRNVILTDLVIFREHYPILAYILAFSFFFLAGLPPFYLFFLKFSTFYVLIESLSSYYIILIFLICNFISIYYYINLIKILLFNPLSSYNYLRKEISSFTILLILCFGLYFLSPFVFIFIKNLYVLLCKITKNYFYNFFNHSTYNNINKRFYISSKLLHEKSLFVYRNYFNFNNFNTNAITLNFFRPIILVDKLKRKILITNLTLQNLKYLRFSYVYKKVKLIYDLLVDFELKFNMYFKYPKKQLNLIVFNSIKTLAVKTIKVSYIFINHKKMFSHLLYKVLKNYSIKDVFKKNKTTVTLAFDNLKLVKYFVIKFWNMYVLPTRFLDFTKKDILYNIILNKLFFASVKINLFKLNKKKKYIPSSWIYAMPKFWLKFEYFYFNAIADLLNRFLWNSSSLFKSMSKDKGK